MYEPVSHKVCGERPIQAAANLVPGRNRELPTQHSSMPQEVLKEGRKAVALVNKYEHGTCFGGAEAAKSRKGLLVEQPACMWRPSTWGVKDQSIQ